MSQISPDDDFKRTLLQETARRLQRPEPDAGLDLQDFGVRPRIGQILDRLQNPVLAQGQSVRIGPYQFDSFALTLSDDMRNIRLTEKERDILQALLQAPGRRIERRDMLVKVWGYASGVETHTLETHVYRLRQKLEVDPAKPAILLTDDEGYALA